MAIVVGHDQGLTSGIGAAALLGGAQDRQLQDRQYDVQLANLQNQIAQTQNLNQYHQANVAQNQAELAQRERLNQSQHEFQAEQNRQQQAATAALSQQNFNQHLIQSAPPSVRNEMLLNQVQLTPEDEQFHRMLTNSLSRIDQQIALGQMSQSEGNAGKQEVNVMLAPLQQRQFMAQTLRQQVDRDRAQQDVAANIYEHQDSSGNILSIYRDPRTGHITQLQSPKAMGPTELAALYHQVSENLTRTVDGVKVRPEHAEVVEEMRQILGQFRPTPQRGPLRAPQQPSVAQAVPGQAPVSQAPRFQDMTQPPGAAPAQFSSAAPAQQTTPFAQGSSFALGTPATNQPGTLGYEIARVQRELGDFVRGGGGDRERVAREWVRKARRYQEQPRSAPPPGQPPLLNPEAVNQELRQGLAAPPQQPGLWRFLRDNASFPPPAPAGMELFP